MKRVQKLLSAALACAMTLSCVLPLGAMAAKSFNDVKGHWAADQIKNAVSRGYVAGYENGSFRPNAPVTRAEFCKMINNAMGLKSSAPVSLTDVYTSDWFYSEVCKSVSAGYISGYEDGSFRANEKITRQEAAVVISRIISEPGSEKNLSDLSDGNLVAYWAQGGAKAVFSKGYMEGDNQRKFNPNGNLTRGEAVKIVESILGGEKINTSTESISANQTVSNTVYTGNVSVNSNGNVTLQNCRILGTLQVGGESTVRLQDTSVTNLSVSTSSGRAEVIASGKADVQNSSLSVGASLTESGLYGEGFRKVELSGTKLSVQTATLSGAFQTVNVASRSNVNLRTGSIRLLKLQSYASTSKIDLSSNTSVERAELAGSGDFTGRGVIYVAAVSGTGSTFETDPQKFEGKTAFAPTISPRNGATDVALNDSIQLTFPETAYSSVRGPLSRSYVEDSVIELRRNSTGGTKQSFTASLSSNNRVITIKPDKLESGSMYYVIIKSGSLKNSSGQSNDYTSFYFTAGTGLLPTVYPANGADSIPVNTSLSLSFPEYMYQSNGSTSLSSSYLQNYVLELRTGSTSGRTVDFSVSISDRKTINISINRSLSTNTRYYLIIKADSLANSDRSTLPEQIYSFTTANSDILVPSMNPSSGSTGVSVGSDLELRFDSAIYTSSGSSTVSSSYLEDNVFTLRRGSTSGSTTEVTARLDSARKVVTLDPDSDLRNDTTYYLIMDSRSLCDSSSSNRNYNEKLVLSFTTKVEGSRLTLEPTPSPRTGATGVSTGSSITLSFDTAIYQSDRAKSNISDSYLQNTAIELRAGSSSGSTQRFYATLSNNRKTITITPRSSLTNDTRYYVIVRDGTLQNDSGEKNSKYTTYFTYGDGTALLYPRVSPTDGAVGVSTRPTITLDFSDDIYDTSNTRLQNNDSSRNYVQKNAIQLRAGSESGSIVPLSVDSISSNRYISITPASGTTLVNGTTYFLILMDGELRNSAGQSNRRQIFRFTAGSGLTVTNTPQAGATGVDRTAPITLYFSHALRDASNGSELSNTTVNSVLKNYINLTGTGVSAPSFTLQLSGDGRTITVRPDASLEANRTYNLSLSANRVMNYDGNKNSSIAFSFTTSGTVLQPIVNPANESSNVPTRQAISLSFSELLYTPGHIALKDTDVKDVIELRVGSKSGPTVSCSASVTDGKIITIRPTQELANSTRYCIILMGETLTTSSTSTVKNAEQTFYFTTTEPNYLQTPTMEIPTEGNDSKKDITLSFATELSTMTEEYLLSKLKLSTGEGGTTVVPLKSAQFSGKTIITLTTENVLTPGGNYYITAAAGVFSDGSGIKNQAFTLQKQAPAFSIALDAPTVTKDSATLRVSYNYPIVMTLTLNDGTTAKTLRNAFEPASCPFTETLSTLTPGTEYTASLSYYLVGALPSTATVTKKTFWTPSISTVKTLDEVIVTDAEGKYTRLGGGKMTDELAVKPLNGKVTLQPVTTNDKATVTVSGSTLTSSGYEIELSGKTEVTITVTAESGAQAEYKLTLTTTTPTPPTSP